MIITIEKLNNLIDFDQKYFYDFLNLSDNLKTEKLFLLKELLNINNHF